MISVLEEFSLEGSGSRVSGWRHWSTAGSNFFITKNNARAPLESVKKVDGRRKITSARRSPESAASSAASTNSSAMALPAKIQFRLSKLIVLWSWN
jgi:hypothetical protein